MVISTQTGRQSAPGIEAVNVVVAGAPIPALFRVTAVTVLLTGITGSRLFYRKSSRIKPVDVL
ncbi:hypothetical protein [Spirosoma litoris]